MNMENWKQVGGYEELYEVSSLGRVRSRFRILSPAVDSNGYLIVSLSKEGISRTRTVHRLVANAFVANLQDKPHINHVDGEKLNNAASNLEWVTPIENSRHAIRSGLMNGPRGERQHQHKLTEAQVIEVLSLRGTRSCASLGKQFGVSPKAINFIHLGINWKHLQPMNNEAHERENRPSA